MLSRHPLIGVLALQGDFANHQRVLLECGADAHLIRHPADLERLDGLILPGGESTTLQILLERNDLWQPLEARISAGLPTLATCAGLIILAREASGGMKGQRSMGLIRVAVERNGFGAQIHSFEAEVCLGDGGEPFHGVFIRAPRIVDPGNTEVIATLGGNPVGVQDRNAIGLAFHPELTGDTRLMRRFLQLVIDTSAQTLGRRGGRRL